MSAAQPNEISEQVLQARHQVAVGRMAGVVAHDLGNLLSVMGSNIELAGETLDTLATQVGEHELGLLRQELDELRTAVLRAGEATAGLLTMAMRNERRDRHSHVPEVIAEVCSLVGRSLPPCLELRADVGELPTVVGRPGDLQSSILNLVLNAVEAVRPAGLVEVSARARGRPAHEVVVRVADDGRGMTEATRQQAFEPLFTTKPGGTGLGLAMVEAFAAEVGGAVELDSDPTRGTSVTLRIPVSGSA